MKLYLDDIRNPEESAYTDLIYDSPEEVANDIYRQDGWTIVRTFWEFKNHLTKHGLPEIISFDYVLDSMEYTGLDCAQQLIHYMKVKSLNKLPIWYVHSTYSDKYKITELLNEYENEHK